MSEVDCLNRLNSTLLRPAVLLTQWARAIFFLAFFLLKWTTILVNQRMKKSTARKTRPTLVEKMAMLAEMCAGVGRSVFVLAAVSSKRSALIHGNFVGE